MVGVAPSPSPRRESGHALIMALVVLLLVQFALLLIAGSLRLKMKVFERETKTVSLIALSDAAVASTVAHIAQRPFYSGLDEQQFGGGTISSEVTKIDARRWSLRATARYGGLTRIVEAQVISTHEGLRVVGWHRVRDED